MTRCSFAKANVIQMKNQHLSFSTVQFHHIEMRGIMLEGILKMDSGVCPLCLPCLAVPPFLLAHPKIIIMDFFFKKSYVCHSSVFVLLTVFGMKLFYLAIYKIRCLKKMKKKNLWAVVTLSTNMQYLKVWRYLIYR